MAYQNHGTSTSGTENAENKENSACLAIFSSLVIPPHFRKISLISSRLRGPQQNLSGNGIELLPM